MNATSAKLGGRNFPKERIQRFQEIVNHLVTIFKVSAALINEIDFPTLQVVIASSNELNPFEPGYSEKIYGRFCEKTIKGKTIHEVHNAHKDPLYKNKPGLEENKMISYLGFPIFWPNEKLFGTICVVDHQERHFTLEYKHLLQEFAKEVELHLEIVYNKQSHTEKVKNLLINLQNLKEQQKYIHLLISSIKHDIKNDAFAGLASLQLAQKYPEKFEKYRDLAIKVLKQVLASIDKLEDLEKFNSADSQAELKDINLKKRLKKIQQDYESGQIELTGETSTRCDEFIDVIIRELIRNAFKHTDTPKVTVQINDKTDKTIVNIIDYGKEGIPAHLVKKYFTSASKLENQMNENLNGLEISKKIVKYYNGKLNYERTQNKTILQLIIPKKDFSFDSS